MNDADILAHTRNTVAHLMDEILANFKAGAMITVIVRRPTNDEADFLMTSETDLDQVAAVISRRQAAAAAVITLPQSPTGADLVEAVRAYAREAGVSLRSVLDQLTTDHRRWMDQTAIALRPKAHTIARVRALLAGEPVPPPPPNNFQGRRPPKAPTDDERKVLEWIGRCARKGQPCPTNLEISEVLNHSSASSGSRTLDMLEHKGLIMIESAGKHRVATIVATGERTAGKLPTRRARPAPDAVKRDYRPIRPREPIDPPPPVDREPCFRCGVRADIGCAHQRREVLEHVL